jgi:HEPN domain-containing protein/predicted nucleotidyltransferase
MVLVEDARDVSRSIVKALNPISIVLFGSVAREGRGDDLDLLIVIDDNSATLQEIDLTVSKNLKPFYKKFAIDPFVIPLTLLKEHHLKGSPFLRLVLKEGRSLYMKDAVKEWIKQAKNELDMALYLFQGGFLRGVCYHSQQSIEKSLKASLLARGWELERTHNIERLISITEDYAISIGIKDEDTVFIDSIHRGRCPAEVGMLPLGEPSSSDAKRALEIAENTYSSIPD